MKRAAILQSSYIPWKGYFDIINMVDEFVLYDDAQFTKNEWRNRNRIKTSGGPQWLTIPVQHDHGQAIKDVHVSSPAWNTKHWRSIAQNYSRARFFDEYKERLEALYLESPEPLLSRINFKFTSAICDWLGIKTRLSWSMDYSLQGGQTEKLVNLCKCLGATSYLSGPAARVYLDESLFDQAGISVVYMDYADYPEYGQLFPPFEHSVTVLDLILNEGPAATTYMKSFGHRSR